MKAKTKDKILSTSFLLLKTSLLSISKLFLLAVTSDSVRNSFCKIERKMKNMFPFQIETAPFQLAGLSLIQLLHQVFPNWVLNIKE